MTPDPVRGLFSNLKGYAPARVESDGSKPGGRGVRAVVLAVLLVGAALAGGATGAVAASTSTDGMVAVPDSNISADLPSGANVGLSVEDLEGATETSAHASTTEVILTTPERASDYVGSRIGTESGSLALVIQDDTAHDGRRVSLPADALKAALGYLPETVHGVHDSGETWTRPVEAGGGRLAFDVPRFSSNSVTFSGTVRVTANPATDGASFQYGVTELDAVENAPVVNLTGVLNTEWENKSATGVGLDHSATLSVGGNVEPTDGAGGDPVLEVTGIAEGTGTYSPTSSTGSPNVDFIGDTSGNDPLNTEFRVVPGQSGQITSISPYISYVGGDYSGLNVDVYIAEGQPDGDPTDGTLVKSDWTPTWSEGRQSLTLDSAYAVTEGADYSLQFVAQSSNNDGSQDYLLVPGPSDYSSGVGMWSSQSGTDTNKANIEYTVENKVENVQVSDGDGHIHTFGNFTDGETKVATLDLATTAETLDFSGSGGGSINYSLTMQERTQTVDPAIELNGHTESVSGTLGDGETANLTLNKSWVESGTNTLNVSVGDGSLSADAPTPAVGLNYSHGAVDDVSVDYQGETWTERYAVTRSWGDAVEDATLTVPFASDVVAIRDAQFRVNGGVWETLTAEDYSLNGTTLTAHLGDLPENATTDVRVNGSRVQVANGSINVLEPTVAGNDLQTRFEVTSTSGTLSVDVSGTPSGEWTHYLENESWTNPREYARVDGSGQTLVLPEASAGARATARTLPLKVRPQTDVHVHVAEAGASPVLDVTPGAVTGDSVEYGWFAASSGKTYGLLSKTAGGTPRDKVEAADGVAWLTDEKKDAETLEIAVVDSGGSTTDSTSDSSRQVPIIDDVRSAAPSVPPVLLLAVGTAALLGGAWVVRRTRLRVWTVYPVIGLVAVVTLESLRPGTVTGTFAQIATAFGGKASQVAPALLLGGGGLALWAIYRVVGKWTSKKRIIIRPGK